MDLPLWLRRLDEAAERVGLPRARPFCVCHEDGSQLSCMEVSLALRLHFGEG